MRTFEGHGGLIWGIDWSREQDVLVTAGADGIVRWRSCRLVVNWVKPRPILGTM